MLQDPKKWGRGGERKKDTIQESVDAGGGRVGQVAEVAGTGSSKGLKTWRFGGLTRGGRGDVGM